MSGVAMASPNLPDRVELKLGARQPMSRYLWLSLARSTSKFEVTAFLQTNALATFSSAPLSGWQLYMPSQKRHASLMLSAQRSYSAYALLPAEAEAIAAQFEPHGLEVQR